MFKTYIKIYFVIVLRFSPDEFYRKYFFYVTVMKHDAIILLIFGKNQYLTFSF